MHPSIFLIISEANPDIKQADILSTYRYISRHEILIELSVSTGSVATVSLVCRRQTILFPVPYAGFFCLKNANVVTIVSPREYIL